MNHLFPIFLNLNDQLCLVIGGGKVAERKIYNLLDYGAQIKVISPQICPQIELWAREKLVHLEQREFFVDDLKDAFIVFAATDDTKLNQEISRLCRSHGALVNAVDDPPCCDFFVPSILRRNSLVVAISTEGKSPAYARRLRRELEEIITREHGEFVDLLGDLRELIKNNVADINQRRAIFEALVNSDILELIKAGEEDRIRERVKECMSL